MAIKVGGTTVINDSKKGIFETVNPGQYTTANRPSNPVEGDVIYDTDEKNIYVWNGTEWVPGGGGDFEPPVLVSNTLTQDDVNGNRFTNNSFTSTLNNTGGDATDCLMTATVTGAVAIVAGTQPITTNAYPGTGSTEVELTLEGAANLGGGVFEVDDEVKANASYTPETDLITTVEDIYDWNQSQTWSNAPQSGTPYPGYAWSNAFNTNFSDAASGSSYSYSNINLSAFNLVDSQGIILGTTTPIYGTNESLKVNGIEQSSETSTYLGLDDDSVSMYRLNATTLGLVEVNGYVGISYFKVNGQKLIDFGFTGSTKIGNKITLPSEKDIELFQAGDVVQGVEGGSWGSSNFAAGYPGTNAFDGRVGDAGDAAVPNSSPLPVTCRWEGRISIPSNSTVTAKVWAQSGTGGGNLKVNDVDVTPAPTGGGGTNLVDIDITSAAGSSITSLEITRTITSNGGIGYAAILIDGVAVTGTEYTTVSGNFTSVLATDVSAKTIIVDGGTWDTSNQSQVWSEGVTATAAYAANYGPENIFDGDTSTACTLNDGGNVNSITITFSPPIPFTTSVETSRTAGPTTTGAVFCAVNNEAEGSAIAVPYSSDGNVKTQIRSGSGTLSELRYFNSGPSNPAVTNIWVDGKLLVDAALDSQVWSQNNTGYASDKGASFSFNGKTSSSNGFSMPSAKGVSARITFNPVSATKIEVYHLNQAGAPGISFDYYINDQIQRVTRDNNPEGWATLYDGAEISINGLGATASNAGSSGGIGGGHTAWKLNGKLLVDPGARGLGDTKVSTASAKRGSGTISNITGSVVTISPFTDNCFKEGQHLVHVTPKPVLVNPKTDAINSVSGNTLLLASSKDLYQFANGDPVSMCNADGTPATVELETDTIQKVEDAVYERTNTPGPTYTGSFNSSYPNYDLFTQRYVDAYNATSDGGSMYEVGYFSSIGPATLISDMDINPGIELKPGDTVDVYLYPYSFTTTLYFNGIDVGSTDGSNYVTKGDSFRVDLTAFFAAGETTITNATFSVPGGGSRQSGWLGFEVNGSIDYLSKKKLTLQGTTNLNQFNPGDVVQDPFVVVDKDEAVPSIDVSGGFWYGADGSGNPGASTKVTQNKLPAGTVDSVNVNTNTMLLKDDGSNNGLWVNGYYVATPEKLASSTKGYVRFDSDGQVECIESYPLPATNMQNKIAPKLRFPDKFECVDATPDSELGSSTYLQTEVQLKNLFGDSDVKQSDILIPQTSTYTVAAGAASLNTTEYAESAAKIKTQSERAAQMRVDNAQQSLQDWQSDFTDEANNYSI